MNINLNIPLVMMTKLTEAVVQLAADYATVHASQLKAAREPPPPTAEGHFFYQSDHQLFVDEQRAKENLMEIV